MSAHGTDSEKKHRHDEGHVPHVAETQEAVTTAVQYSLATCVVLSAALVVYALLASANAL